jgi:hypothetical protein
VRNGCKVGAQSIHARQSIGANLPIKIFSLGVASHFSRMAA